MYKRLNAVCYSWNVLHEVITFGLWHRSYVHAVSCNIIPLGMCQIGKRYVNDRIWNIARKKQIDCQKYHNINLDELLKYEILLRERNICVTRRKMGYRTPRMCRQRICFCFCSKCCQESSRYNFFPSETFLGGKGLATKTFLGGKHFSLRTF